MKKLVMLIPAVLVLTGCTAYVDDKYHIPEFTRDHEECYRSTKHGCTDKKELNVRVPECWRLVIEDGLEKTNICVSKEIWEKTQIGQAWSDDTYVS